MCPLFWGKISVTSFLYNDPLKRLTRITNKNSSSQVINAYSYLYNTLDLRSSETITNNDPVIPTVFGATTYTNNNVNEVTSATNPNRAYIYDDDGNMTTGYTPAGYSLAMTYDAENRLTSAEYTDGQNVRRRVEYYYGGDSLVSEVKRLHWDGEVYDWIQDSARRYVRAGFLPIQERDENNNVIREYVWGLNYGGGIGGLLNLKQGGANYSYLYNGRGDVTAVLNSSQATVAKYTYDAFGILKAKTGALDQPFQYSTKEYDPQTGLSYFGYRFYSPVIGRWITRDPIGEAGGMNLYGYVANNPVNMIDLWGLDSLVFQGGNLTHYNDQGKPIGSYPATSGAPGVTDPASSWQGPIPAGGYTLNPSEISPGGFLRDLTGDWGKYRVPLHPNAGTDTHNRSGFFLHGGKKPGSAGCIDVGDKDVDFFPKLMGHNGAIPITVK